MGFSPSLRRRQVGRVTEIAIFETDAQQIEMRLEGETVWLTQRQMTELFDKDVRTINEHIGNIFHEGELEREGTIRKFRIVRREGNREVRREVEHYSLDVIISVGYRVKSQRGVRFRQWATRVLREHLTQGYSLKDIMRRDKLSLDIFWLKDKSLDDLDNLPSRTSWPRRLLRMSRPGWRAFVRCWRDWPIEHLIGCLTRAALQCRLHIFQLCPARKRSVKPCLFSRQLSQNSLDGGLGLVVEHGVTNPRLQRCNRRFYGIDPLRQLI